MYLGGRKQALVPTGMQNIAESAVDFVEDGIIMETIGPDGLKYTPFLLTLFTFILTCNIWGLIPGVQMPVNARIALPVFMAHAGVRRSTTPSASSRRGRSSTSSRS